MQRCVAGVVDLAVDGEVDILETKGLGAGFRRGGVEVFCRSEEPEEGHDNKVGDMSVEGTEVSMQEVEGFEHGGEDGDVDRVGASGWIFFLLESFDEVGEDRVLVIGLDSERADRESWIRTSHVGYPLANGRENL